MKHLFKKLQNYKEKGIYPFHMPGHKRNFPPVPFLDMDITEIPGFDNLNSPTGILKDLNSRFARMFGAEESFLSVNGATACIHAAVFSLCGNGGKIAIGANSHKSLFSALLISGAEPVFMTPEFLDNLNVFGSITPGTVEKAISENPDLKGVFIVSPTYEGICSDIKSIGEICHKKGIPLVVDASHGSHFFISDYFPKTALSQGADIVIHGIHKTLPFPTQTGLLHVQGNLVERDLLASLIHGVTSSSPSYILMGAAEEALSFMEENLETAGEKYVKTLEAFRNECGKLKNIRLLDKDAQAEKIFDYDRGKLVFFGKERPLSPSKLEKILFENRIQAEALGPNHVTLMTSFCDTPSGFGILSEALKKADSQDIYSEKISLKPAEHSLKIPMRKAFFGGKSLCKIKNSLGKISSDFVTVYPPGIPVLIPGEEIGRSQITLINKAFSQGTEVQGLSPRGEIKVLA